MAYRTSADRPTAELWDRDRFEYERDRDRDRDRDRRGDVRERFEEEDDRVYVRRRSRPPPHRFPDDGSDSDVVIRERERSRERRRVVYDDSDDDNDDDVGRGPRPTRRRRSSLSPPEYWRRPVSPPPREEVERSRVVIEKERYRSPSPEPPRRPAARLIRRQSSLDTFDRKPARRYWERELERDEYGPPARRDDYRVPPYVDIPLPRAKALTPPRRYGERDEIHVACPHRYKEDDLHAYPGRVRETEVIRTRRRTRSRDSKGTSRRGQSRSSSRSSSSSSESRGTIRTSRSEYPKRGKTRIPARLVSKRALIELGYPYVEEGNVIIVQKALGQQNIHDLLKLSDKYKKSELEIMAARSSAGDIIEERIEHRTEVYEGAAALPPPPPPSTQVVTGTVSGNGPVIIEANPPPHYQQPEVVKTTVIRDVRDGSTSRYTTSSYDTSSSYDTYTTSRTSSPTAVVAREVSSHVPIGPVALAGHHRRDAYETEDLRSEIRHLEKQLTRRERSRHSRSRHRSRSRGDLVRAERLNTGELVLYEEEVERIQEPARASGPRIEKDKRGRLSISVPRYR
ncbi:uncharacterized protein P884DRAFT_279699 [Thermothelomyces heterothallicus CBS 202.75]|uniref:uncharacterized protein n=1 Tax=Thermothelomyces heterothallicus CBS 202.75 TaxID=1149848 RepID=UPI003743FAC5